MITNNYKALLSSNLVSVDGENTPLLPVTGTNGTTYYLCGNGDEGFPTTVGDNVTLSASAAGIMLGTGDTGADETDTALDEPITSGISASAVHTRGMSDGNPYIEYTITVENTGYSAITLNEVGYIQTVYASASQSSAGAPLTVAVLLERTVFSTPITVAAGATKYIKYRMASAPGSGDITVEALSVTADGTYTAPTGKAYNPVMVNVGGGATLQTKTVTPSASQQYIEPDSGYDGLSAVTVEGVIAPNLIAENIKKDVVIKVGTSTDDDSVMTITGTYEGGGGGSGFIADTYSQFLNAVFDTGVSINSDYRIEVAFYANAYVNDGHIVGQSYSGAGSAFHLTTYNNKWFIGGTYETSFSATNDYPVSGEDIVYSAKTGEVTMNGIVATTIFTMPNQTSYTYKLNTRGGSVSTSGKYKYKYVKVFDANEDLLCHWEFGSINLGGTSVYLAHDIVTNTYKLY